MSSSQGAPAPRRVTAQHPFFSINPAGQTLFSVRAGIPLTDALERALCLMSSALASIYAITDEYDDEVIFGAAYLVELGETSFHGSDGRLQHVSEYRISKRDSYVIVAQLSPEFTARLVDRWQALEAQVAAQASALPDFSNPVAAARAWADAKESEQRLALENRAQAEALAAAAPKAAALERIAGAEGEACISNAAKNIGLSRSQGFALLSAEIHWIFRRPGSATWIPYQSVIDKGLMELRVITVTRPDGTEKLIEQAVVTPRGIAWLAEYLEKRRAA